MQFPPSTCTHVATSGGSSRRRLSFRFGYAALAIGLVCVAAPTFADDAPTVQAPTAATSGPKIAFESDTWDFGQKWRGEPVAGSVKFTNIGDAELKINKVRAGCGCTGVRATKMSLQPGESAELSLSYDTNRRGDSVKKVVKVFTNEGGGAEHTIQIVGKVRSVVEIKPQERIVFQALSRDEPTTEEVQIQNLRDEPLKLSIDETKAKNVKFELTEVEPGRRWTLRATTETPLTNDVIQGNITLKTGFEPSPTQRIQVFGRIQPRVALTPQRLLIPPTSTSEMSRTLRLTTRGDTNIHVTSVETSSPAIKAELMDTPTPTAVRPNAMSTTAVIRVTLPPATQLSEKGETITIHTDDPQTPVIRAKVARAQTRRAAG